MVSISRSARGTRLAFAGFMAALLLGVGAATPAAAKPIPLITSYSCTQDGNSPTSLTTVAWDGFHPSRIEFSWTSTIGFGTYTETYLRPKGSSLSITTPSFNGSYLDPKDGGVVVYGPHGLVLRDYVGDCGAA